MHMTKGDVEGLRGPVGGPSTSASKTITGIVDVPLRHKDPNKSLLTKALHHVRDYKTAVKNGRAFAPYSYIERKTRQATRSTVAYGPLGGMLSRRFCRPHSHLLTLTRPFVHSFVRSFVRRAD